MADTSTELWRALGALEAGRVSQQDLGLAKEYIFQEIRREGQLIRDLQDAMKASLHARVDIQQNDLSALNKHLNTLAERLSALEAMAREIAEAPPARPPSDLYWRLGFGTALSLIAILIGADHVPFPEVF